MNVFDLSVGSVCKVIKVTAEKEAKERLTYLGIKAGNSVEVLGFSLFNSAVLLGAGYAKIAIRKSLAEQIQIEVISFAAKKSGLKFKRRGR